MTAPSKTLRGTPSIIQTIPVNGYTLYAEEISHVSKEHPADLLGHTMWKAPTLATAAASGTSPVTLPKRQRSVLSTYSISNNGKKSTRSFVSDQNGNAVPLYYENYNGTPMWDNLNGGLIFLSAMRDVAYQNSQTGNISTGYAMIRNPFIITEENPVFRNSDTDVAKAISDLRAQGYDGLVFDYHDGDRYAVMVFNAGQIVSDQDFQNYDKEESETRMPGTIPTAFFHR